MTIVERQARLAVRVTLTIGENMSKPLHYTDPAYWMLQRGIDEYEGRRPNTGWITEKTIHKDGCFICEDYEFALMGMPLCKPCVVCGAHTAADDDECDNGHSQYEGMAKRK